MSVQQASGETLRIIKQKIKEDEFSQNESLEHIKDWLKKSPHLPDEYGPDDSAGAINLADGLKVLTMNADVRLAEECVAGDIYIVDLSKTKASHCIKLTPTILREATIITLQGYPMRIKAVHIVNMAPWIVKIYNFLKLLIPEKMQNRVHFHNNIHGLHENISKELLPKEYGGGIGSLHDLHDKWIQKIADSTDWFKEQETIKSNEALRLNRYIDLEEVFGMQGSFRQLAID